MGCNSKRFEIHTFGGIDGLNSILHWNFLIQIFEEDVIMTLLMMTHENVVNARSKSPRFSQAYSRNTDFA